MLQVSQQKTTLKLSNMKITQTVPIKIDDLNSWEYINPSNQNDDLPQPYRYINKIIQEDILNSVYSKIFEIEKYKNDPNYEGNLKTLPPQGSFDISNITAIGKDIQNNQSHNHLLAGDATGSIMILDLNKKMRITKREVGNGKRVTKISVVQCESPDDTQIENVAVICHLDNTVYIYRYRLGENKIYLHYTISIGKQVNPEGKKYKISDFPIDLQFSLYGQFLMVTLYSGNILVYKIPEFQVQKAQIEEKIQPSSLQKPGQKPPPIPQAQAIQLPSQRTVTQQGGSLPLEVKPEEISEIFYKVEFKGVKKEPKFSDIIQQLKNEQNQAQEMYKKQIQQTKRIQIQTKEDPKKKAPGTVKGQEKKEETIQQTIDDIELNDIYQDINIFKVTGNVDASECLTPQKFKTVSYFINQESLYTQGQKLFNPVKPYKIVTGLIVAWMNSNIFEIHFFQAQNKQNLPELLQQRIRQMQTAPEQQQTTTQGSQQQSPLTVLQSIHNPPKVAFDPKVRQVRALYPLTSLNLSQSSSFTAAGLKQGSVIIYDVTTQQEKYYLDKHNAAVSHLEFCDDWRLVSGAKDGSIHIYDLLDQGKLLMKRTNHFKQGGILSERKATKNLAIASLSVSSSGVAAALDFSNEIRLYDIWHGEKIAKLNAQQVMDDKKRSWSLWPEALMKSYKQEIIVIADAFDPKLKDEQITDLSFTWNKQTSIQIFKVFDSLINLFPALSNVYRRGVEKEKIIHLYSKIDKNSLKDPSFEVPSLSSNIQTGLLGIPQDQKSQTKSRFSVVSKDKMSTLQSGHGKTKDSKEFLDKIREEQQQQNAADQVQNYKKKIINKVSLINSLHKSSVSDSNPDFNSSFRSIGTVQNVQNKQSVTSIQQNKNVLTKHMLHPEQFFLERDKIPVPKLLNENEIFIEHCRQRNSDKNGRLERMNGLISKLGNQLQQQEEKNILLKKKKILNSNTKN